MIKKISIALLIILISILLLKIFIKPKTYLASDFGIETIISKNDYDNDGVDDYTDIMLGARMDAINKPKYKSVYYAGGYPPDDEGVCSDVIWRAFKNAGYNLKDMIDLDIKNNPDDYPGLDKVPDPNIDFRRVRNLKVFFDKYATSLTLDPYNIAAWQPGDIVIFGTSYNHIGIISDKRNKKGIPYLIHNASQYNREEDALEAWYKKSGITGHYRYEGE
ncbi:MAG: DUF1287 domain-containing protein [Bacilli bacterium]|nr:DUF1287 domain-containing protein [Bacilli bacterium]